jgi:hypothetical protein
MSKNGTAIGGRAFEYGSLRCLLSNRLYAGQVEHKGKLFPGQHEAIVDRQLFEEAQTVLASLSSSAVSGPKLVSGSLLQGLIVDRHGRTMGPVHTTRNGQRFRYYVTHPKCIGEGDPAPFRLAADAIENIICELLADHLTRQVTNIDARSDADRISTTLNGSDYRERRELMIERVRKVTIGDASLTLLLNDGTTLERKLERIRHGNDAKLIVGEPCATTQGKVRPQLIVLLRDAHRAQTLALAKPKLSLDQLAKLFGRSAERYKRLLRLSYLSPKLVQAIINGEQPARITNRFLQNLDGIPLSWTDQEELLLR